MERRLAMPARALFLGALAAALLLAAGCGGDTAKFFGTWELDLGRAADFAQGYSLTMAFRRDGTGTMTTTQAVDANLPPTQSVQFQWEIKGKQLVISVPDAGATQKMDYEFQEDGTLSLRAGQTPPMTYRRVE
jgi:hypothetical protein